MSEAQAAAELDRLPWLANEAAPPTTNNLREISGWLVAAALLVGGGAYWLVEQGRQPGPASQVPPARTTTVVLPQAQIASQQLRAGLPVHGASAQPPRGIGIPDIAADPLHPSDAGADHLKVNAAESKACKCTPSAKAIAASAQPKATVGASDAPHLANASAQPSPLGARGGVESSLRAHLVQVGAFAHVEEAKVVWREMMRAYPAVTQLDPALIENRDWNGRPFYQFQVGTASQADSEMLCQSMLRSNFRCAVVGLPGKVQR